MAEEEMLFSDEEFLRAASHPQADQIREAVSQVGPDVSVGLDLVGAEQASSARFAQDPAVSADVRAWFEGHSSDAPPEDVEEAEPERPQVLQQIAEFLPSVLAREVNSEERRATMQRFSMAATSATVSLSAVPRVANIFL